MRIVTSTLFVAVFVAVIWIVVLTVRSKRLGRVLPWSLIMLVPGVGLPVLALTSAVRLGPVPWILGGMFTAMGVGGLLWGLWSARRDDDLRSRGLPATAYVQSVTDTGWTSFNLRVLKLTLLIHVPGSAPYEVRHRARVHDLVVPLIMSGNGLPVLVDPDNPQRILLALADGTPAAQRRPGESDIPAAEPDPRWGAGPVHSNARSGRATIVSVADHYPPTRTTDGDPVFDFELDVDLLDQRPPYRVHVAERIPTSLALSPTPGMVVDVEVDSVDPTGVSIVWDLSAGGPSIGMEARTVPPELSSRLGVSGGVEIGSVEPGSAAERSGLQRGDVIVKIDELAVSTMNEFAAVIRRRPPGSDVVLTVWRTGRLTTSTLSLPGRSSLSTNQPA
ncbi:MAG TPA: PDZ domain-containing protein [Propionibacteriaceae bacterium]|nr:PDZ domain-containing protein [Propionibacteriaceae bacterium]